MSDTNYLQVITTWIVDNKEWVFSGFGVSATTIFGGLLFRRRQSSGQHAHSEGNSKTFLAGGNISTTEVHNHNGMSGSDVIILANELFNNLCKQQLIISEAYAYIKFYPKSPTKISNAKNITSLTDHGTMEFSVNFKDPFENEEYVVNASGDGSVNFTVIKKLKHTAQIVFTDPCPNTVLLEFKR